MKNRGIKNTTEWQEATSVVCATDTDLAHQLIVWNDDVNTFDWVINTLVQVCKHEPEQAEQCSIIIHFKGKCAVKTGAYEDLLPMQQAIIDRGIGATLEAVDYI